MRKGKSEVRVKGTREKERKKNKIKCKITITVYICTVTVTLLNIYKVMQALMWVFFWIKCVKLLYLL